MAELNRSITLTFVPNARIKCANTACRKDGQVEHKVKWSLKKKMNVDIYLCHDCYEKFKSSGEEIMDYNEFTKYLLSTAEYYPPLPSDLKPEDITGYEVEAVTVDFPRSLDCNCVKCTSGLRYTSHLYSRVVLRTTTRNYYGTLPGREDTFLHSTMQTEEIKS